MLIRCPYTDTRALVDVRCAFDHIQKSWAAGTFYEGGGILRDVAERFGSVKVVYDIGASIGNHTLFYALALGAYVVAVEPHPPSLNHLRFHLNLNRLGTDRVLSLWAAAGNDPKATCHTVATDTYNVGMVRTAEGGACPVVCVDDLAVSHPVPDVVKIDVEGDEAKVLRGMRHTLKQHRPALYIEGHRDTLDSLLDPYGYQCIGTFNATPTHLYVHV